MVKKYIITGGPGSGKTTLLNLLDSYGFETVPEAARTVLAENKGLDGTALQDTITKKQVELEDLAEGNGPLRIAFCDRGVPDNLAYMVYLGIEPSDTYLELLAKSDYEHHVFFLEPIPQDDFENDAVRQETYTEAGRLSDQIKKTYRELGYELDCLPATTPQDRARKIQDRVLANEVKI